MDGARDLRMAGLASVAFVAWTALVASSALDAADEAVGHALVDPGHLDAWAAVTSVGSLGSMAVLVAGAVLFCLLRRDLVGAVLAGAVPLAGWGAGRFLKLVVDRPRPDWGLVVESSRSYPSNHALTSWMLWVCVVWVLTRDRPRRAAWTAAGVAPAVAVAYSRVALGVHHASDVVGSWLLGLAVLAALPTVTRWLDGRWPRPRGTSPPVPDGH